MSYYCAIIINLVCALPPWWNILTSVILIFTSMLPLFHEHLPSGWENLHISFLWTWTKGKQNHKISCGCGKLKWKPEEELKSRQMNSFARKGRHHISNWCKVLQAPQIRTTITCRGNTKQIQPWFGSTQGQHCLKRRTLRLQLRNVEFLRKSISTGF